MFHQYRAKTRICACLNRSGRSKTRATVPKSGKIILEFFAIALFGISHPARARGMPDEDSRLVQKWVAAVPRFVMMFYAHLRLRRVGISAAMPSNASDPGTGIGGPKKRLSIETSSPLDL